MNKIFEKTQNVKNFIGLVENLQNKPKNIPKMGLVYGEPGLGKSQTALWLAYKYEGVYLRSSNLMTGRWLLEEMVKELDEIPRFLTSDNFNIVVKKLKKNPQIIFIDEIDYLMNNYKSIETLRDIHDETDCPIIFVGMGLTHRKLRGPKDSAAVDTIYETFKKYYLNTNKFSTEVALKLAQNELQNDGKIAFPLVHNAKSFYNKLIKELGKPSIEHLRNTAEFIIPEENKEVVTPSYKVIDITFKEAAANYLKNLSKLKKEERLLSEKTLYKNQIAYYFDDYKINEITPDVLREYKQEKYNSGYSVSSVKTYLALVKSIITHACPYKEQMAKQLEILSAIDMNILDKSQIEKLLSLAKREFKWGYPIIRLGLLSGANVPEILALQWENVFFSEKRIHISKFLHSGKIVKHRGNSPFRNLTIDNETVKTLAELFIKQIPSKEDFVFKMDGIVDINKYFEESILKPISEKLELGEFNSIDLTHNFVNMLLTQNVPITYIRKVCGYPSIKTFLEVYNSRLQESEKEYYNPLDIK